MDLLSDKKRKAVEIQRGQQIEHWTYVPEKSAGLPESAGNLF
jgi:hypothetical protein